MDYKRIYESFIESRLLIEKQAMDSGYYEIHHIVPRSFGGSDSSSNLIALSFRDHIFAHAVLAKAFGGRMWYAYWMMVNGTTHERAKKSGASVRVSSKAASIAKSNLAKYMSDTRSGEKHHYFGVQRSNEVRKKISDSLKSKHKEGYIPPHAGRKATKEQRERLSEALKTYYRNGGESWIKGKTHSPEARRKISLAQTGERHRLYGKKMPESQAKKIGLAQVGLKNHAADHSIYKFMHVTGDVFIGYRTEFIKKYGLCKANIGRLVKGTQKQHKGWTLEKINNDSTT